MTVGQVLGRHETHSCCKLGTLEHLTTCHDCGARTEGMDVDMTADRGEPICQPCARTVRQSASWAANALTDYP